MEEYCVTFQQARLLKERGYNGVCRYIYAYGNSTPIENLVGLDNHNDRGYYLAPTITGAALWIYEKWGIYIKVYENSNVVTFYSNEPPNDKSIIDNIVKEFSISTLVHSEAIDYALNHLIHIRCTPQK